MLKKILIISFVILFHIFIYSTTTSSTTRNLNIDGIITTSANGSNSTGWEPNETLTGADGQTYYLSWDDNNLYIGKAGGNTTEPHLIYIQADFTGSQYTATAFNYDGNIPNFSNMTGINFSFYAKSEPYDEYRTWNGTAWSTNNTELNVLYNSDNMEVSIPWGKVTQNNGKPDHFRIVFYRGYNGGTYGQSPTGNPTGTTPTVSAWWGGYSVTSGIAPNSLNNQVLPVELNSFNAIVSGNTITIHWQTSTELNNSGFDIEKKSKGKNWTKVAFVEGHGNSNSTKNYSYTDKVELNGKYQYRLKQIDNDGTFEYSKTVEVDVNAVPAVYALEQNYPNPFNPSTTIRFSLPEDANIKLTVYNVLGQEVRSLINGFKPAGEHIVNFDAAGLNSGLYFYKLETAKFNSVRKMLLTK